MMRWQEQKRKRHLRGNWVRGLSVGDKGYVGYSSKDSCIIIIL